MLCTIFPIQRLHTSIRIYIYFLILSQDPNLWYGIGMLYDRYGSLEHAEEAFDAVLKMDAKFEIAHEVRFRLGIIAKQQGRYDEALDVNTDYKQHLICLTCFLSSFQRLRRTLEDVTDREMAGDVWAQIGHTYELKNEVCGLILNNYLCLRNLTYISCYQIQRAKHAYLQVVEHNPNNSKALQQLGWLCMKAPGENAMAIDYFKKAVAAGQHYRSSIFFLLT